MFCWIKGRTRVYKCVRACVCAAQGGGKYGSLKGTSGKASEALPFAPRDTRMYSTLKLAAGPLPPPLLPSTRSWRTPASTLVSLLLRRSGPSLRGPFSTQQHRNDGRDGGGNLSHVSLRWPCTSLVRTTRPQDAPHTGPSLFLHVALQVT